MSNDEEQLPDEPIADEPMPDEPMDESVDEPIEKIAKQKPARGNAVAWLAILLSIAALAGVTYTVIGDWQSSADADEALRPADLQALERRVADSANELAALETQVGSIPSRDLSGDIETVRRDVDDKIRLLDSLPARMSTIENSVASLAGISTGARETFLLAEAEYYMQIANAQLQLANNPHLASLALGMADERVTQLSDPALTDVRRALFDERAALEVMEKPDLEGATLTLASLARVVESLPLASARALDDATDESDPDESGVDRAWGSVKDAMSGLVRITPPEQAKLAMLSPDAEYFLRNNIAMQLQAARLALLRGEQAIFEQALDDTSALLESYFDGDSEQVTGAQQTIAEIRNSIFTVAAPDISGSLRLLRQYRTLSETTE